MENNLNIESGTINFWIKENTIIFNDDKINEIFNLNPIGGSIFMVKDSDNKFKIMYVVLGKGRIDLEYNVSSLDINKRHMISITWDINKSLVLYVDWKEVKNEKVVF